MKRPIMIPKITHRNTCVILLNINNCFIMEESKHNSTKIESSVNLETYGQPAHENDKIFIKTELSKLFKANSGFL